MVFSTMPAAPRGSGEHVFIVEDEESLARIFGRLLQSIGYLVTVQTHPRKALELFEKDPAPYQIALVDLHMPPPGGAYVAKRLHEIRPELPIFIMSGYSDALGVGTPEDLGIVGILQKPVTRETLAAELRRALDGSSAQ
jgi:two-component system, cell cycle sensor histidine kinase and response regulator CckA